VAAAVLVVLVAAAAVAAAAAAEGGGGSMVGRQRFGHIATPPGFRLPTPTTCQVRREGWCFLFVLIRQGEEGARASTRFMGTAPRSLDAANTYLLTGASGSASAGASPSNTRTRARSSTIKRNTAEQPEKEEHEEEEKFNLSISPFFP
jgi:hypothetical protein